MEALVEVQEVRGVTQEVPVVLSKVGLEVLEVQGAFLEVGEVLPIVDLQFQVDLP